MDKSKLKTIIIGIALVSIVLGIGVFVIRKYSSGDSYSHTYTNMHSTTNISSMRNYVSGDAVDYKIDVGYCDMGSTTCIENTFVRTYDEFEKYINQYEEIKINNINVLEYFDEEYFNNHTMAIQAHDATYASDDYNIDTITKVGKQVNVNINLTDYSYGGMFAPTIGFEFIALDKDVEYVNFNVVRTYIDNLEDYAVVDKPVIYLYPTEETKVSVELGNSENITVSYPKYTDGWDVIAKPNGRLTDLNTNRQLYSLYYEAKNLVDFDITKEGFIVKGEDTIPFLEEKLAILGLNDIEAEEFIIYWLPILQENKYNYIRFATEEEINKNMPLTIKPNPDTIIRVVMTYKGLNEKIDVVEQKLTAPQRNRFTVVEWGGTEIK